MLEFFLILMEYKPIKEVRIYISVYAIHSYISFSFSFLQIKVNFIKTV